MPVRESFLGLIDPHRSRAISTADAHRHFYLAIAALGTLVGVSLIAAIVGYLSTPQSTRISSNVRLPVVEAI